MSVPIFRDKNNILLGLKNRKLLGEINGGFFTKLKLFKWLWVFEETGVYYIVSPEGGKSLSSSPSVILRS